MRSPPFCRPLPLTTLLTALLAITSAAPPIAQPLLAQDSSLSARVDRIFAEYDRHGSPGCAVGVAQGGRLVHQRGYGMANLDHDIPLSSSSVFYIASVSKQFTAAVTALLAAEGYLSLDDDVRAYVPELPDYGHTITFRHLIHHTSGLRDYLELMNMAGMRVEDVYSDDEVLQLIARQRRLNFEPGAEYLYSNTGYFLISVITKRVTGKTFREYADEKIFQPLGMRRTHFHDDRQMIVPGRVMAYSPDDEAGFRQNYWANFEKVGSGGLLSTVEDLFLWDQNFYRNQLTPADLLETMHSRGLLNSGDTIEYAFGLQLSEYRGLRTVRHGGSSMGFRAHLLRFPDQRFSTIVLCNIGTANPANLAEQVAGIYLADHFTEAPSVATAVAAAPRGEGAETPALPVLTTARLQEYAGRYHADELDVDYTLILEGDQLTLHRPAASSAALTPTGPDTFRAGTRTIRFTRDSRGQLTGFTLDAGRVRGVDFRRR